MPQVPPFSFSMDHMKKFCLKDHTPSRNFWPNPNSLLFTREKFPKSGQKSATLKLGQTGKKKADEQARELPAADLFRGLTRGEAQLSEQPDLWWPGLIAKASFCALWQTLGETARAPPTLTIHL